MSYIAYELNKLRSEIDLLVRINDNKIQSDKKQKHIYIAMLLFLNRLEDYPLFGASIFNVKVSKKTMTLLKMIFTPLDQFEKIALNYQGLLILGMVQNPFFNLFSCKAGIIAQLQLTKICQTQFQNSQFYFSIGNTQESLKFKIDRIDDFRNMFEIYQEILSLD